MAIVSVRNLYYAKLKTDPLGGTPTWDAPVRIPGVQKVDVKVKSSTEKNYAEGQIWEQETTVSDMEMSINVTDLTNAIYATLMGHKIGTKGGVITNKDDTPIDVAILVEFPKTKGKSAYRVYYDGVFQEPDEGAEGKEDKVKFQNRSITASFQPLKSTGDWKYGVDSDDPSIDAAVITNWFTQVTVDTPKVV